MWIDNVTAQRIVARPEPFVVDMSRLAARRAQRLGVSPGPAACPVCHEILALTRVPPSPIEIDVCAAHGTWFDRSELDTLIETALHRQPAPAPGAPATSPPVLDDRDRALDDHLRQLFDEYHRRRTADVVGTMIGGLIESLGDSARR